MSGHIKSPKQPSAYPGGQELLATICRITWEDGDGSAVIGETAAGDKFLCEGAGGELHEGDTVRMLGRYETDPKWGRQFKAATFLKHAGHDKAGVIKYLVDNCVGVGKKKAEQLWEAYGESVVRGLREEPGVVAQDGLMSQTEAEGCSYELKRIARFEATTIDLHSLFLGRGLGPTAIAACIQKWGLASPAIARKNPFSLLRAGIPRAGFQTCDRLYLDLGGNPHGLKRQALAGWDAVARDGKGSTWHGAEVFAQGVIKQIGVQGMNLPRALALAMRRTWGIPALLTTRGNLVADPQQARNEDIVAECIARLFEHDEDCWLVPAMSRCSQHQRMQVSEVCWSPVMLLTGGPGTGKTHTLAAMLRAIADRHGEACLAVCAPTGKAAVRITQAMKKHVLENEATTIHRLLRVQRNGNDGGGWGFEFDRKNPLPYRYVAVDEFSMCDTDLFAALLMALAPGTCLLLVGDENQLPPVGHGAPLRDMIAANMPRAHLSKIERNSGMITDAYAALVAGRRVEFCDKLDVDAGRNAKWVECQDEVAQLAALKSIVETLRAKVGVNLREDLQVLTPRNEESLVACKNLNSYLQQLCNPVFDTDPKPKNEGFRLRDKVICRSNTQTDKWRFRPGQKLHLTESWDKAQGTLLDEARTFIANGDMGYVVAVSTTRAEIIVKFLYPDRIVKWRIAGKKDADDKSLGGKKDDLQLAYAITGHKSQGSEWPYVVAICDPSGERVASKEYWSTVLTRPTKWVIGLGKRSVFDKQVRRAELPMRKTFLRELLLEINVNEPTPEVTNGVLAATAASGKEGDNEFDW